MNRGLSPRRWWRAFSHGMNQSSPHSTPPSDIPAKSSFLKEGVSVTLSGHVYIDREWRSSGVTAQFIEDAATYHERYFDRLDFEDLIRTMLRHAEVPLDAHLNILDIGSGGGSSVFAALKLLPNAHVVASDISPPLLSMLANFAASREELRSRVSTFCFDLHRPFFAHESFDLVIGCAILHHLANPYEALKHVAHSMKQGGKLVLCEPLEAGNLFNNFIYDEIIEIVRKDSDATDPRLAGLMKAMRRDIQHRQGPPDEKPWTQHLDDKWIFDSAYLAQLGTQLGCSSVNIHPVQDDLSHVFEVSFKSLLADSGNADVAIPERVLSFLREVDAGISPALKKKLCPTGIIVITK